MRMKTTTTLLAATLLLPAPAFAAADTDWLLKGENVKVEICSQCHPFFTGKQKLVDF